ncbi:MAG: T9SS type A sorting domain-containing protein, partial [Bacteroidales bacterium]|jgi:hypothetical protein|nr:T9SS type A sorting domain-containing protein [Bacteroidales bacterium]
MDSTTEIIINGGVFETRNYFLLCHKDNTPEGGYVEINGSGQLSCLLTSPGRFPTNASEENGIKMTENATILVKGDWVAGAESSIAAGYIYSDDITDPYAYYDVDIAKTYVALRSKDELFLKTSGTVQVFEDAIIDTVSAVENRAFETLTDKEWKYATTSGGPYMSFAVAQTDDALIDASFTDAGVYYVILEATNGSTTKVSNELNISVSSEMVSLKPIAQQTLRQGQMGGMITVTEDETAESREWKWSETSGSDYQAFASPVTATEYTPDFDSLGIYYVICESVVGGTSYKSPEVTIKVVELSFPTQDLYWTGLYGTDAGDNRNYDPMMLPFANQIIISKDFVNNPPVLSTPGTESISKIYCEDSAEIIVRKANTDTLFVGNSGVYQAGKIIVESGIVVMNKGYGRLDTDNAGIVVKGNGQFIHDFAGGFIIGKNGTPIGGSITIQDDAYLYVHHFWRFATDTAHSVITISENALLEMAGDITADVATWKAKNQIRAKEGFTIKYAYDASTDMTKVVAKSDIAFNVASAEAQFTGVGILGDEITTINDANVSAKEWKYATSSNGEYMSFDPAQTAATFAPMFADTGIYYVVCEGMEGTEKVVTDEVVITAVSVEVAPAADQQIEALTTFATLSFTTSMTPDRQEWKISTTSGSGYASFPVSAKTKTCSAMMMTDGVYYVVVECYYGETTVVSNEVKIVVGESAAINSSSVKTFNIYPNPSQGRFFITTSEVGQISVKIYDITGKSVLSNSNVSNEGVELNKAGLYYIEVSQNGQKEVSKILVK